jgi:hypothetical protein
MIWVMERPSRRPPRRGDRGTIAAQPAAEASIAALALMMKAPHQLKPHQPGDEISLSASLRWHQRQRQQLRERRTRRQSRRDLLVAARASQAAATTKSREHSSLETRLRRIEERWSLKLLGELEK